MTEPVATYIRHRDRMVQESVFEDLSNTLIACRWMPGTTSREVVSPYDNERTWQLVTTQETQVLKLVGSLNGNGSGPAYVTLVDFFPESTDDQEAPVVGDPESGQTRVNTLAIDDGQPGEPDPMELGSNMVEQPYIFRLAFYANSDAVAKAVLNDLRDRYRGDIVGGAFIDLYDYNTGGEESVVRMDVDGFQYTRDTDEVTGTEASMFYAQFIVTDFVG